MWDDPDVGVGPGNKLDSFVSWKLKIISFFKLSNLVFLVCTFLRFIQKREEIFQLVKFTHLIGRGYK